MVRKPTNKVKGVERHRPPNIPMLAIRRFARQIAKRFQPDKIVLFGSYAYGKPHQDSDVDLLVVMQAANETSQAIRLTLAFERPFPLDLIVRTPENLRRRLADGNWFLREVMEKGKVLYEKRNQALGSEGRRGFQRRQKFSSRLASS
jgi:predicted nucleotidyltransferase